MLSYHFVLSASLFSKQREMAEAKDIIKTWGGRIFGKLIRNSPLRADIRIILTYHHVVKRLPQGICDRALFVEASTFEMHMRELGQFCEMVPLEAMRGRFERGGRRLCAVTFDDGWLDIYETAVPILQKYQIPATVFLPVAMIGTTRWFWFESLMNLARLTRKNGRGHSFVNYFRRTVPRWAKPGLSVEALLTLTSELKCFPANELDPLILGAYRELGEKFPRRKIVLGWQEVTELGESGVSFGSHGLNHYILPMVNTHIKKEEIFQSMQILKNKGVSTVPYFSYPNGDWDDETLEMLSEAGYKGALTTRLGNNSSKTPPFPLNRVSMHEDISRTPGLFWFRIFQAILAGAGIRTTAAIAS